jgi:hypothetical protein
MKTSMKLRIALCFTLLGLSGSSALAADDSFVGKWKLNPDKSQFNGLEYKIEDAGGGQYRFIFGDDVEVLTLDGKGHVTKYGDTWSIKATGPSSWESVNKREGKVTAKSKWTISEDGQTFTTVDENMRPDGSTGRSESTLKRTGGNTGLAGTWESASVKIMTPISIEIAKWEGDGYSLVNPAYKQRLHFKLDGKDYKPTGPRVAEGTTVSASKSGDRNMELTYKLKDKTTETDRWELSDDGKTLTQTVNYSGVSKPEVDVFDRE